MSSDWHNAMLALSLGLPKHVVFPAMYAPPTSLEAAEAGITENDAEANGRSARGSLVPPVDVSASGARYWRGVRVPAVLYRPPIPKTAAKAAIAGGGGDKEEDDGGGDEEGPDDGAAELATERGGADDEDEEAPATAVDGRGSNVDARGGRRGAAAVAVGRPATAAAQTTTNSANHPTGPAPATLAAAASLGSVKPATPARDGAELADGGDDTDEGAEEDDAEVAAAPVPQVAGAPPSRDRGEKRSRLTAEPKPAAADDRVGARSVMDAGNTALPVRGVRQGPQTGAASDESAAHALPPRPEAPAAAPSSPLPPETEVPAAGTRRELPPVMVQPPPLQPEQPPIRPPPEDVVAAAAVAQMRPFSAALEDAKEQKAGDQQGGEVENDGELEEGQDGEGPFSGGAVGQAGAEASVPVRGPVAAASAPLVPPPADAALLPDPGGQPDTAGIDSPPAEEGGAEGLGGPDDLDGPGLLGGDDGGGDAAGSWAQPPQDRRLLRWRAPRRRLLDAAAAAATPTATPGPQVDPSSTPEGQTRCFRRLAITGASGYLFGDVRTASMFRVAALRSAGLIDQPPFVGPGMNAFFRDHLPPKRGALLPPGAVPAGRRRRIRPAQPSHVTSCSPHHRPEGRPPAQHGERGGGEAAAGCV